MVCQDKGGVEGTVRAQCSGQKIGKKEERKPSGLLADPYYACCVPDTSLYKPNILLILK